jgi:signal transduction histidine kinase
VWSLDDPNSTAEVLIDPFMIKRVIGNLVNNACLYTPVGGTITLQAVLQGNSVWIAVGDTGPGIAQERLPHIFQRFYKEEGSLGKGLGLAIAREIVEQHGGTIWAESEPGVGSRFIFTLPVYQSPGSNL